MPATYIMVLFFFMGTTFIAASALGYMGAEVRRLRIENEKLRNHSVYKAETEHEGTIK